MTNETSDDNNTNAAEIWKSLDNYEELESSQIDKFLSDMRILTRNKNLDLDTNLNEIYIRKLIDLASKNHVEAQKCLSNIILNYKEVRGQIVDRYIECVANRLESCKKNPDDLETSNDRDFQVKLNELIYYDLRIIFLLSALCPGSRATIRDNLSSPIFSLIHREADRYCKDNHAFIVEALKTLFNLTMEKCIDSSLAEAVIEKLLKIVEVRSDPSFQVEEQIVELLVNLIHLFTNMPQSIYSVLSQGDANRILDHLDSQLRAPKSVSSFNDTVLPILNCCTNICKHNRSIRKNWFEMILLSITDFEKRPEQYDNLRGRLVKLMTSVDVHLKDIAADFLYSLCDSDTEKFITYTGLGNAASYLSSRGLLGPNMKQETSEAKSGIKSLNTYEAVKDKIDPITGMLERPKQNKLLESMTESEKEYQAEELANAISRLSNLGMMKAMQFDADGKLKEVCTGEKSNQDGSIN